MKNAVILFILLFIFHSCREKEHSGKESASTQVSDSLLKTGGVRYIRLESGHQIWTKKVGHGPIKLLLLHDGPGLSHDYLQCFEDFIQGTGIEIYYYDQLGCGNSDHPSDTALWNISRFREEVEEVRKALGLEQFYLFGHGWGGMLALEYLTAYQDNLKGAVISNATAGLHQDYKTSLLKKYLSGQEYQIMDSLSRVKSYQTPQYQKILYSKFYSQTLCRMKPWPAPLLTSMAKSNFEQYRHMMGDNALACEGNLLKWKRQDTLRTLSLPCLVIGGKMDEVNPEVLKKEGRMMPNSRTIMCSQGSRMSLYDEQIRYFRELLRFLKETEEGTFTPDPLPES
jgi:proline iminopeptidase